jgi:hypothetical protein
MRMIAALVVGLGLVGPALGQGLPSDVEQKLGLRKNASPAEVERALSDYQRSGRRLPSDTEQKLRIWLSQQRAGPGRPGDFSGPPRRYDRDYDRRSYERGYEDLRDRCERRAERRGLDGRDFRRYVRDCLDRG